MEKYELSVALDAFAALARGEGTYHIVVEPESVRKKLKERLKDALQSIQDYENERNETR